MGKLQFCLSVLLLSLLVGCSTPAPVSTALPTVDLYYASNGGGDPRTPGYWSLWNTCAPDNRAEIARANGGRAAGWFLVDDLLADPGISLGSLPVETCPQALNLLQGLNLAGEKTPGDDAYLLVQQLLAAELNLNVGSEACVAVETALLEAQSLLERVQFDGFGAFLGFRSAFEDQRAQARQLIQDLTSYNQGALCR